MPEADLHEIDFLSLGPENLINLGEDFVRALPFVSRDSPRSRTEEGWIDSISEVVSRAGTSPASLSSSDAGVLAETFHKGIQLFHLSNSLMRDLWIRLHMHAVIRALNIFPNVELSGGSPDYQPLGFLDIWKGYYYGDQVCIKAIRTRSTVHLAEIKRTFYHEVEGCKRISHPNILPVIQVSETLFPLCIVSPWMPDGNIMQYVRKHDDANRLMLLAEVCDGLSYLHGSNILHGCIAPGNILITPDGRACLGDFGIVGALNDRSFSRFKLETASYMAPERVDLLRSSPSIKGDVYSLGMTSFTVLTGVLPYDGVRGHYSLVLGIRSGDRPLRPMNPDGTQVLQNSVWAMITACWSENPDQRWEISAMYDLFSALSLPEVPKFKSVGRQQRGGIVPRIVSLFQFLLDSEPEVNRFVNELDERLGDRTMSGGERRRLLNELCKTCSRHRVIPKSMHFPDCSEGSVEVEHGGYSTVSRGTYEGREVAIKIAHVQTNNLEAVLKSFCREAVAWKHLRHPNILPLLGVTIKEYRFAMVSEWMDHGNIKEYIRRDQHANRIALLVDVANGLKYMHELRVVHGDLKGANILINKNRRACVADFGLTTITGIGTHTDPGASPVSSTSNASLMSFTGGGTYRWMSPELLDPERFGIPLVEGDRPTRQSDCYALGMVIYEVLCGHAPYVEIESDALIINAITGGDRPKKPEAAARLGFTDELWTILGKCWEENRDARPSVGSVLSCLNDATAPWYTRGSNS